MEPRRIGRDDQLEFADAEPTFQLLLAGDGRSNNGEPLEVDEAVYVVPGGMAVWVFLLLMLLHSDLKFGSDADVELLEAVGEDIDVGVFVQDDGV